MLSTFIFAFVVDVFNEFAGGDMFSEFFNADNSIFMSEAIDGLKNTLPPTNSFLCQMNFMEIIRLSPT